MNAKGQKYETVNFSKKVEWMKGAAFVHDDLLVQLRPVSHEKTVNIWRPIKNISVFDVGDGWRNNIINFHFQHKIFKQMCGLRQYPWIAGLRCFHEMCTEWSIWKVRETRLCFLCLRGGYARKDFKMKETGIDGGKRRHKGLFHQLEDTESLLTMSMETFKTHESVGLHSFGFLHVYEL